MIINEISRIDVIVGGDHAQGVFNFLMKVLFVMKSRKTGGHISSVAYILCKKDHVDILSYIMIKKLQNLFILMLESMTFDNQQLYIRNMYVASNLAF